MTFRRPHHQQIAAVLGCLDAEFLRVHDCYFGGGTAIALKYGEYRESIDIDFLVSDRNSYRSLRTAVRDQGFSALLSQSAVGIRFSEGRADQYGLRTRASAGGRSIKFEVVLEGRIDLDLPTETDQIVGVSTLTRLDMAVSKLLANSDRGLDATVHRRDLIDLAMLHLTAKEFQLAMDKANRAYGTIVSKDLAAVIAVVSDRKGELERCMTAMDVSVTRAELWQRIKRVRQLLVEYQRKLEI